MLQPFLCVFVFEVLFRTPDYTVFLNAMHNYLGRYERDYRYCITFIHKLFAQLS